MSELDVILYSASAVLFIFGVYLIVSALRSKPKLTKADLDPIGDPMLLNDDPTIAPVDRLRLYVSDPKYFRPITAQEGEAILAELERSHVA